MFPGRECSGEFAKKFEKKITEAFSETELDAVARTTEFKIRRSKVTPRMFVDTILFKEMDNASISLEDHCISLKQRYDVTIKKQSLAERFDVRAVRFIQELLNRQLSNQICSAIQKEKLGNAFEHFSSVKLKDSTRFQVPECLKEYYPGSTGAASGAGVHIQFEFDILNGKVDALTVSDALRQDVTDAYETKEAIEKGSLIIRDLGYFSTNVLEHIHQREAYYISRTKSRMNFFHAANGKTIDFDSVYRKMKRENLSHMELPIIIGDKKMPSRLIAEILPEKEVEKRLAKANREAKKKGRKVTEEYKSRARLNVFMTNVPKEWLATSQIRRTYQIRWQIELRFKAWKSFYKIDSIKKMQRYRFECYLYSTLLLLMINLEVGNSFFAILWKHTSKPLSFLKFFKTTSQNVSVFRQILMKGEGSLINHLIFLYEVSYEKLLTEKRKNHSGSLVEILNQNID